MVFLALIMTDQLALLLTHSGDYYTIDRVQAAFEAAGVRAIRLNTDLFPQQVQLYQHLGAAHTQLLIDTGAETISLADVGGVWLRKQFAARFDDNLDPQFMQGCMRESAAAISTMYQQLWHLPWIDRPDVGRHAENKFYQLQTALQVGLTIPDTIITNKPEQVKAFYQKHQGNIITKMLTPLSQSMQGSSFFVRTTKVAAHDLEQLEGLSYSPMVFQQNIEKAYELRLVYVGGTCFAGKIDASASQTGQTDWRASQPGEVHWQPYAVPKPLAQQVTELMGKLQLHFGALDIIRTPAGGYVFLEVNPAGEWGMLERDLDYPIAATIAKVLMQRMH